MCLHLVNEMQSEIWKWREREREKEGERKREGEGGKEGGRRREGGREGGRKRERKGRVMRLDGMSMHMVGRKLVFG